MREFRPGVESGGLSVLDSEFLRAKDRAIARGISNKMARFEVSRSCKI